MSEQILYGTIKVRSGNKIHTVKRAVWIVGANIYKPYKSPFKDTTYIIEVIESKVIGVTNISKEYTKVKASNEKRNKITGAYE